MLLPHKLSVMYYLVRYAITKELPSPWVLFPTDKTHITSWYFVSSGLVLWNANICDMCTSDICYTQYTSSPGLKYIYKDDAVTSVNLDFVNEQSTLARVWLHYKNHFANKHSTHITERKYVLTHVHIYDADYNWFYNGTHSASTSNLHILIHIW